MPKIIILNTHPIQYFAPLYKKMVAEGMNIEVWYCSDESIKGNLDKGFGAKVKWDIPLLDGYNYRFFKNHSWKPSIYNGYWGLINLGILKALLKEPKCILWVHGWGNFITQAAILVAKLRGHKVYLRAESPLNQELLKSKTNRLFKRIFLQFYLFKLVKKFLYIGKQNKLFYLHYGVNENKLIFIPYSVDNERFANSAKELLPQKTKLRVELGLPVESKIILYSGKYIPKKRPVDLLKAFEKLNFSNKNKYSLVMMGDGELRPQMQQYIEENKLEQVFLTGFVNQSDIVKYYAIADVFVMCSEQGETWGLSVNEAMNFGLPIVVSDLTGCSIDLVKEKKNGFIHKTGNIEDLAEKISKALEINSSNSAEIIKDYSFDVIISNIKKAVA